MRRIDELHLNYPFAGSRMLRDMLSHQSLEVGRRHVRTLMRRMGIEALYRKPNTSKPAPGHKVYPYLLRGLAITRPNQVWATDISYIPMARGFVYLAAVIDWFSRRVLSWRLSITMDTSFCIEALDEALSLYGKPEIFNTDQGSQFTSEAFTGRLKEEGIQISMDGKRPLGRQRLRRAAVAFAQIRARLLARLRVGQRSKKQDRALLRVLQLPTPTFQPGGADAGPGILPPSARGFGGITRNQAGRGNAGLMESAENDKAVSRPSHKTLKIDEADFHISTATTTS